MVMAIDIARTKPLFDEDPNKLPQFLTFQASVRGLAAAIVLDKDLNVIARADVNDQPDLRLPPREALPNITDKEPQVVLLPDTNYVAAIIKLQKYRRRLSLRDAAARSARGAAIAGDARERAANMPRSRRAALGVQVAFGADVHRDRADRAAVGGVDRLELRQPPGGADPPPDRRRQSGVDRQSLCARAGAPVGGRPRPARRDLQPHDAGTAHASATTSCARATSSTAAAASPRRCWPAPAPASSASTATAASASSTARPRS